MSYLINRRYVSPLMVNFYEGESTLVFVNASFGENALSTVVLKVTSGVNRQARLSRGFPFSSFSLPSSD